MKLNIHPTVIFRTPKFSYHAELSACWEELKAAIAISSTAFYEHIKDVNADEVHQLPPKIFFTIWKYFNRAKFRPTPYGTFASFSILADAVKPSDEQIIVEENQKIRALIDWPSKNNIHFNFVELIEQNCLLFSNSSYYLALNSIRYIACTNGLFELAEIDKNDFVLAILSACLKPIRVVELVKVLGLDDDELANLYGLLQDMHELQLVFTNFDPNIIGEDYFERIGLKPEDYPAKYLIAERTVKSGHVDERLLQAVPGLVKLLQGTLPFDNKPALKQFVDKFTKKFEGKEIPLALALDPEMGVGYDELEQAGGSDDFIAQLNIKKVTEKATNDLKALLSNQLSTQYFKRGETILLNKLPLKLNEKLPTLPNSMSMIMSVVDDLIFVDQIGGSTANALGGRFSMANNEVEAYCKSIAEIEQEANPDVLFFDVAYMVETNVDNINRRKLLYQYQLSILNFDTSSDPLTLNDIQVSIQGSEVVLRSKRFNRRIVPKMASAYNYTRSDLSVFRLLCDLQQQSLQASLSLSLDNIFPDLDYYPRLQYQNLVLSASKWKIKKQDLCDLNKQFIPIDQCREYLQKLGVSQFFKAGISDQTLCFNLANDVDLQAFTQFIQKQTSIYLEEVILPNRNLVVDQYGKPYLSQFIVNLYHRDKIYRGVKEPNVKSEVKEFFPPGKEWLYFEVFCHQQRTDQILAEVIMPFLNQYQSAIKLWFFIRYSENGNHIRFRILLNDENYGQRLTSQFVDELEVYLSSGLISDIQVKTYKRELERYGADAIALIEQHFAVDSEFVLSLFETQPSDFDKYQLCAALAYNLQASGIFDRKTLTNAVRIMADIFTNEHDLDAADFKKLNGQFQLFRKSEFQALNDHQQQKFNEFSASFSSVLIKSEPEKLTKLFGDLMHMHVNRLFSKDQRTHEMIMYYFLSKDLQRQNAINC
ncbi:lantibiotic dehydratase [Pedobacter frigidisoli]|nr:lantibiotic dehydratase [Pedobacter frigidisoli]